MSRGDASVSFESWLHEVLLCRELEVSDALLLEFAARFNSKVHELLQSHGDAIVAAAIAFLYGTSSGYMSILSNASLGSTRVTFMDSVKEVYRQGFGPFCSRYYSHLDAGPEAPRPLNATCYMMWDMHGLEQPAMRGDDDMLDASLEVLRYAIAHPNVACQESALHGLGHLASCHRSRTSSIVIDYLNQPGLTEEMREYAYAALNGMIL